MRVIWSPEASEDLRSLGDYIAADNPEAARRVVLIIVRAAEEILAENPSIGRAGRLLDTREFAVPRTPVVIIYRVKHRVLQIVGVHHHSRRWPDLF